MAASLEEGALQLLLLPSPWSSGTPHNLHTHGPGARRALSTAPILRPLS